MNKRRMKYRYWDNIRNCINVTTTSSIVLMEVPPGFAIYGPSEFRKLDSAEGRTLRDISEIDPGRKTDQSVSGRDDSAFTSDCFRQRLM